MGHITNYGLDISHYLDGFNNHQSGFSIKFNSFDGLAEVSGAQRRVNDIEKDSRRMGPSWTWEPWEPWEPKPRVQSHYYGYPHYNL